MPSRNVKRSYLSTQTFYQEIAGYLFKARAPSQNRYHFNILQSIHHSI